jgi:hypothetical protein
LCPFFGNFVTGYCLPDIIDARDRIFIGEILKNFGKFRKKAQESFGEKPAGNDEHFYCMPFDTTNAGTC